MTATHTAAPLATTGMIAIIAAAGGLLVTYYTPDLIPGLILGVLAYLGTVLGLARAFRLDRDQALIGTSRCLLLAVAITLQAILRGCITAINALARWDTSAISRTGA